MIEALIISNIILWIAAIALALMVFALTRQVGILHERIAPAGALMPTSGPKVGELTQALELTALNGDAVTIGGVDKNDLATFILYVSPTCPVCKALVPTAQMLVRSEANRMRLILASDGDEISSHQNYSADMNLDDTPYLLSEELGRTFEVSKLPFAVLIAADGTLRGKGLVNTREHMESLIESMDSGITSVQEYLGNLESGAANVDETPKAMETTS
ncbi:MAG: methylamine dehydrogenase accessory protein MauD [Glaciecola sp.]|jgi:methylamine dehydrogenase accessory protein MauD